MDRWQVWLDQKAILLYRRLYGTVLDGFARRRVAFLEDEIRERRRG